MFLVIGSKIKRLIYFKGRPYPGVYAYRLLWQPGCGVKKASYKKCWNNSSDCHRMSTGRLY